MPKIEMYTTPFCPFCVRAKALLKRKGANFEEIDVTMVPGARDEMLQRSGGRRTVPQIFIDGDGIGGSDELHALESKGELDRLLGA
ncbi:MAG TPA: glutaredoxin 3 [Alphaproteobacteria bacterium]|jgi:glutaredoxin 3|nr:glutaredoxin 3 [Alphaproteobacteria bacterium]